MANEGTPIYYSQYKAVKDKIDAFRTQVGKPYTWQYAPSGSGVIATAYAVNELQDVAAASSAYKNTGCASYHSYNSGANSSQHGTYYTGLCSGHLSGYYNAYYNPYATSGNGSYNSGYYSRCSNFSYN